MQERIFSPPLLLLLALLAGLVVIPAPAARAQSLACDYATGSPGTWADNRAIWPETWQQDSSTILHGEYAGSTFRPIGANVELFYSTDGSSYLSVSILGGHTYSYAVEGSSSIYITSADPFDLYACVPPAMAGLPTPTPSSSPSPTDTATPTISPTATEVPSPTPFRSFVSLPLSDTNSNTDRDRGGRAAPIAGDQHNQRPTRAADQHVESGRG